MWKAVSEEQLEEKIEECASALPARAREKFDKYKVNPHRISCFRSDKSGIEFVFVVAKNDCCVILYDDVEDEFAIARIADHVPTVEWQLCGELEYALYALPESL
jgi:hypothetical protein